ncbi:MULTISPECIES: general secretion pathway protein GspK [unclassified Sphingomonas]|uniref:general secretion pathway protein GspK n=1 Tax=unclassified Sphingomonas TaxID=196159 RepID=UPI0008365AD1|nr:MULTISPECIES: type II secretion system protein GspK [unclassified Sphingomonas]
MTHGSRPPGEQGMILINVLLFVAIAAGLVLLMINREELALDQGLRGREAARAAAIARGGELSALAALRRDVADAADVDYRGEPWGAVAQQRVEIDGGSFELAIADAQDRFNINNVLSGDAGAVTMFENIGTYAGLSRDEIIQAIGFVRQYGPVSDLRPLRLAGVAPDVAARLERLVTALPGDTAINLNAATPEMLRYLFPDNAAAERLLAIRARNGQLVLSDFADAQLSPPAGTRFSSDTFWVWTRATIGDTRQQLATLIQRRRGADGDEVVPVARWRNAAVPAAAPRSERDAG